MFLCFLSKNSDNNLSFRFTQFQGNITIKYINSQITISQDGSLFAYVNISDKVVIDKLEPQANEYKQTYLSGFDSQIIGLSFSQNLNFIVCASQTTIYIFNIKDQKNIFKITIQNLDQEYTKDYFISEIEFLTNEQILVGTTNGNIILLYLYQDDSKSIDIEQQKDITQQERFKVSYDNLTVKLIEFAQVTKSNITQFLTYDDNNKLIVGDEDGQITIINFQNLKQNKKGFTKICQLQLARSQILSSYLDKQNNNAIFGSLDNKITILNLQKLQILQTFTACRGDILDVQLINNNSILLVLSSTGELNIFDYDNNSKNNEQEASYVSNSQQDTQYLKLLQIPNIQELVQTQQSNTQMRQPKQSVKLSQQTILCAKFVETKGLLVCKTTSIITILNIKNLMQPVPQKQILSHSDSITDIQESIQYENGLISASKDGRLFLINILTNTPIAIYNAKTEIINIAQTQQSLFVATHTQVIQIILVNGQYKVCAEYNCDYRQIVKCIVIEDKLIVATVQGDILIFNAKTSKYEITEVFNPAHIINAHSGSIIDIVYCNDTFVSAGVDLSLFIGKITNNSYQTIKHIYNYSGTVASCISLNQTGIITVCCYDQTIRTFSLQKLKLQKQTQFQSEHIEKLWNECKGQCTNLVIIDQQFGLPTAIQSNQNYIFIGTSNGQILQLNQTLQIQKVLDQEGKFISDSINVLCITKNNLIGSGLTNGSIEIWDITQNDGKFINVQKFQRL